MEAVGKNSTVKETIISCIEAPRLKGISTRHFIEFKRLRELYEKHLEEKGRHLKEEIVATSYRASIEDDDLMIFIAAGWIKWSSIDELTERQIVQCVEERCKKDVTGEELYLVDQAVKSVAIQMHILDAEDRIWSLCKAYSQALRARGYEEIIETRPHIAINHFLKKLKPFQIYRRMVDIITLRKNDGFHKENFNLFVREVAVQAKKIQTELKTIPLPGRQREKDTKKTVYRIISKPNRGKHAPLQHHKEKQDIGEHGKKRKREVYEAPFCLNRTCREKGKRLYINQCDISDKATKDKLLGDYQKAKKARYEETRKQVGSTYRIAATPTLPHSSLFKATFVKGKKETDLMADQGADANFISAPFLDEIKKHLPSVHTEKLSPNLIYRNVTRDPCLTCAQSVKLDIFLQIRHGTSPILRNINWKITDENLKTPIIGRRVLEILGCDNKYLLMAACDKLGDDIEVAENLKEDGNEEENEGVIAALYGESVFHRGGHVEDDGLKDEDIYVDLGDDPIEVVEPELQERIKEARANGLSEGDGKTGANHKS